MSIIPGYYTRDEAAKVIGVTPGRVSQLVSNNELPTIRVGKSLLIPEDSCLAFQRKPAGNPTFGKKSLKKRTKSR